MNNYVFKEIQGLSEFEKSEDWDGARLMLLDLWTKNKDDIDINFRLISECWAVLSDEGCTIELTDDVWDKYKMTLIDSTEYWIKNHKCVEVYSSMIGYMISLFPYLFYNVNAGCNEGYLYGTWEKIGDKLINESYEKYSDNHIVRLIYFGNFGIKSIYHIEYEKERSLVSNSMNKYFTDNTKIERYFIGVWDNELII